MSHRSFAVSVSRAWRSRCHRRISDRFSPFHALGRIPNKFQKGKLHLGFDLNHGIPRKLFLTEGNGSERPFVSRIIDPGQTGVLDRGYKAHHLFDQWQQDGCHFVCRIKEVTHIEIIE